MEKLKSYKELEVWKVSMDFVTEIYKITNSFPSSERCGLTNQIRRSAVSVPSNIAEALGEEIHVNSFTFCIYQTDHYQNLKHNLKLHSD